VTYAGAAAPPITSSVSSSAGNGHGIESPRSRPSSVMSYGSSRQILAIATPQTKIQSSGIHHIIDADDDDDDDDDDGSVICTDDGKSIGDDFQDMSPVALFYYLLTLPIRILYKVRTSHSIDRHAHNHILWYLGDVPSRR